MATKKKPRGRPSKIVWPEPIDASPEDIARAVLQVPHKKVWRFMKEAGVDDPSSFSGEVPDQQAG